MKTGHRWVNSALSLTILTVALWITGGCLGYRVGGHLPPGIQSIFVPTVENVSDQPNLETPTTAAIIEGFQSDGRLHILDAGSADAILEVRITRAESTPLRYDRQATLTATEYRLTLTAEATLTRRTDQSVVLDRRQVNGWVDFSTTGDLPSDRQQAASQAARELGRQIVRAVVEYW